MSKKKTAAELAVEAQAKLNKASLTVNPNDTQRYKIIGPERNGTYSYSVRRITALQASNLAARGYTIIPANKNDLDQNPINLSVKNTYVPFFVRSGAMTHAKHRAAARPKLQPTILDRPVRDIIPKSEFYPRRRLA